MDEAVAKRIISKYGLVCRRVLTAQKGYRNSSYPIELADNTLTNLILYKDEPDIVQRIRRADAVANYLHAHNFPARYSRDASLVRLRKGKHTRYAGLYAYLPGSTIPWEAYTKAHLKLLGKTMSDMHALLRDMPSANLPHVADEYVAIVQRIRRYFADPAVAGAMREKLNLHISDAQLQQLECALKISKALPGSQPLHMDFVRGNILFADRADGPALTGVLDFEKTAQGHPLFDIARTLAFLLVDCKYKSPQTVRSAFLISGYSRRGKTRFTDVTVQHGSHSISVLDALLTLFLTHDFYKFLRHNPYEYLWQNEHFVRTRDQLKARGVIS